MATDIIDAVARLATRTTYEDLPAEVVENAKRLLLDSIGCALGGVTTDPGKMAIGMARELGGPAECAILGTGDRVAITNAVFANGQLVNALDYDTVMPGGHTPPYVVPTVFAMAERERASGRDLIVATAIACEIAARLQLAVPPSMGFHGPEKEFRYAEREGYARINFGSAAGAGRLRGIDHETMVSALALAGHMSQLNTWTRGNYALPRNMSKYGFPGWQNTGAIMGVMFAERGMLGDIELLDDAEQGYGQFSGYGGWKPQRIVEGIGETWITSAPIRFKPYACCTMLHRGVQAFEQILTEQRLHPDEIERVVATASPTVEATLFSDRSMNNIVDLQFGMHYVLAMVAHGERTGADWHDWNKLTDPRIKAFADRVELKPQQDFAETELSTVTVEARGERYTAALAGHTEPLTNEELQLKFRDNATRCLTSKDAETALAGLVGLDDVDDVAELVPYLMA